MSINNPQPNKKVPPSVDLLTNDEIYMLRCIEIAKYGLGSTAPNPMVGAVIVHSGKIIGEGFTSAFGGNHAEVNAIHSVSDKSQLKDATIYVTLEPCSHFGKTPPCADLIIQMGIPKVVIGLKDPHEKVAGNGIKRLKSAGCIVKVGILEQKCKVHHARFLTNCIKKRPYIILKWAETIDGYIAPDTLRRGDKKEPFWITNTRSRQLVHKWRSEEPGILVGTNTVMADNPQLNVRNWTGKNPLRIVLDRELKIPSTYHIFDGKQQTLICTQVVDSKQYNSNARYKIVDFEANLAQQLCKILYEENIQSIIIEGGLHTLQSFIDANLWDEARIFKGTNRFGTGLSAPRIKGYTTQHTQILNDQLTVLHNDQEHYI
ncbi:bifunctional diaminohydroxyphosphoribosylaminopyrimidine deaminase/5-amino-6-(5-phosphoribosylamino)uracil reductase RibD [Maribacter sp. MAR_2009_72]|uniref:bifunctional diaminohydroxyphosphoribosylaminopyrimidine deaminase/5-amino-6-(5-phosphoribosylamino)uracil reductase RibD n=1 Tax=Maribacter sp. MAR_2009_72 TaxID=1250050 RepID=UPI00119940E6|nr:bifunctional diaminohydroxyphosphoribosylaminopyrimidine deaminase/5-amino-6-(5-phosphoribosylamino)uracil reductase RibD [Maribacter sp. MAR_2009_72]TVZ14473.1 diaminohydroxyphosphoribosylaminopyrimidine deaminase [Maribacter sp. MAR_2009_72]